MSYPLYFVNAFAKGISYGNTAAILIIDSYPEDIRMQTLAAELNFSETAYVRKISEGKYHIRWFTPEVEVALCGHATLAASQVIFTKGHYDGDQISFSSLSGELICRKIGDKIELNFPVDMPQASSVSDEVLDALGSAAPEEVLYAPATHNLILVYGDKKLITSMKPDFAALRESGEHEWHGIAVTAASKDTEDYVCRYFAPWEGVNEDPVTGSAQTYLAPYWAAKLGKKALNGYQASERGGRFEVEMAGQRVLIRGEAYIFMTGSVTGI